MAKANEVAIVVTSIAPPNRILKAIADGCLQRCQRFYVIGDVSSPANFSLDGCEFFSLERQRDTGFRVAQEAPTRHYARKNIGYLQAIRDGARLILETDDDNEPTSDFWCDRSSRLHLPVLRQEGWVNIYRYFTGEPVWPRGLPLPAIQRDIAAYEACPVQEIESPIQQGLADENPDVDAIYRLTGQLPVRFRTDRAIALAPRTWCPFNSQNTVFFETAYALLYLPAFCSFRMTDIWRSFIAQRILWENKWLLSFHGPTVVQSRNDHNLMKDFRDEISGYLRNESIAEILGALSLKPGMREIGSNLIYCYEALIKADLFPASELNLVEAWLEDLQSAREFTGQPK